MAFLRAFAGGFFGKIVAAVFIAACISLGFGPKEWFAFIAGDIGWPWVVRAFLVAMGLVTLFFLLRGWWLGRSANRKPSDRLAYLHYEESEIGSAIHDMVRRSAWGRWYAAQILANTQRSMEDRNLLNTASGLVLEALVNGQLQARGRHPGGIDYESISPEVWRLAALMPTPHPASLWTVKVIPRAGINPARIQTLLNYDSLIVNSRLFESLWPATDKDADKKRKQLLRKARKAGVDEAEIRRLS